MRFVVFSDTHFTRSRSEGIWWNRMLFSKGQELGERLVRAVNRLAPDLVFMCGDLTDAGDADSFLDGVNLLNALDAPVHLTLGNHDIFQDRSVAEATLIPAGFDFRDRVIETDPCVFAVLDQANWVWGDGTVHSGVDRVASREGRVIGCGPTDESLDWLRSINVPQSKPLFVVTHFPLAIKPAYPMTTTPKGEPVEKAYTSWSYFSTYLSARRDEILAILMKKPSFAGVFSGHLHFHTRVELEGILHCTTASIVSYPHEFRLVTVENGSVSVSSHGLGDDSLGRASYIQEWGNDWVKGDPHDRAFRFVPG